MLVRIKFSKEGPLKFIGHLDTMRYFQKAFARSGLPLRFSEGFNPHPLLEFANPLGVGLTSNGEYLDFELTKDLSVEEISEALKRALTDGFTLERVTILDDRIPGIKKPSAMSLVEIADYLVYLPECSEADKATLYNALENFLANETLPITVKTKTSEKHLDLKECVFAHAVTFKDFLSALPENEYKYTIRCGIPEGDGAYLYLRLSAGSALNIKPETFLNAFFEKEGLAFNSAKFCSNRIEMYHKTEAGAVPLWAVK